MAEHDVPGAAFQQRAKKRQKAIPRLATLDWLHGLHSALDDGLPHKGLSAFKVPPKAFDEDETPDYNVENIPLLTLGTDEESKQRTAFHFLRDQGFSCLLLKPIHHRRHNDNGLAFGEAGWSSILKKASIIGNCVFGPMLSSTFMSDFRDVSVDIAATVGPDDATFLLVWPWICRSRDWHRDEEINRAARQRFLTELPAEAVAFKKQTKGSKSKWNSLLTQQEEGRTGNPVKFYLLLHMALQKGWISSYEDLWKQAHVPALVKSLASVFEMKANQKKAGKPNKKASLPSSAPASSTDPIAITPATAPAEPSAMATDPWFGSVNTLHTVLKLLADPDAVLKQDVSVHVASATMKAHHHDTTEVKSPEETRAYYVRQAMWGFMPELHGIVGALYRINDLRKLGMMVAFPPSEAGMQLDDPKVARDDQIAQMVWRGVTALLKYHGSSKLFHVSSVPGMWAGLLSESAEERSAAMTRWKATWCSYAAVKEHDTLFELAARHACDCRAAHDLARMCRTSNWEVVQRVQD